MRFSLHLPGLFSDETLETTETSPEGVSLSQQLLMTNHYLGLSKQVTHAGSALCQNSEWGHKAWGSVYRQVCRTTDKMSLKKAGKRHFPHALHMPSIHHSTDAMSRALRESECYSQTYLNTIKNQQRLEPLRCFIPPLSRLETNSLCSSRFSRAQRSLEQSVNTLKLCVSTPEFLPSRDQGAFFFSDFCHFLHECITLCGRCRISLSLEPLLFGCLFTFLIFETRFHAALASLEPS